MAPTPAAADTPALPKPKPLVGHFPAYGKDPLGFVTRIANEIGGVVPIRMGPIPGLVISDPAAIIPMFVSSAGTWGKNNGASSRIVPSLFRARYWLALALIATTFVNPVGV